MALSLAHAPPGVNGASFSTLADAFGIYPFATALIARAAGLQRHRF
jgi:hypothetical protein